MNEVCENYLTLNSSSILTVEENWQYFCSHYTDIVDEHIPYQHLSTRYCIPWLSTSLKRMIRNKQQVCNKAKLSNNSNNWLEYKTLQKQVKGLLQQQHDNYLKDVILISSSNKPFWTYVHKVQKTGIGTLKSRDSVPITDLLQKAKAFNEYFQTVFTNENFDSIPNKGASPLSSISDFQVTMQGIHRLLLNLDPHKPPGPDNIHGRFLKETASEIAPLLTHLFQQYLNSGEVPMVWRQGYITLIFKKGNRSDPRNYCPVSLTFIVCKTMEHVLVSCARKIYT